MVVEKKKSYNTNGLVESAKSAGKAVTAGFNWLWGDLRKPHLLWVKLIFFLQSASLASLYPFLSVHMRSAGFSLEDVGAVSAALPLVDVVGPPLAGAIADRIGNFAVFMAAVTALNGVASLALLVAPVEEREGDQVEMCCHLDWCVNAITGDVVTLNVSNTLCEGSNNTHSDNLESTLCPHPLTCMAAIHAPSQATVPPLALYVAARVVLDVLRTSSLTLFEGAVVVIIQEQGGDYGLQKLFGTAGAVIFGLVAGHLIDAGGGGRKGYAIVFTLYCFLRVTAAAAMLRLSLAFKPPTKKVFSDLYKVLRRLDVLAFLTAFLLAGLLWGLMETYLFWFMEDLGASKLLMGGSLAVGTIAGVPISIFSKLIIERLGYSFVVVSALSLYSVRLLGVSLLPESAPEVSGPLALVLELAKPMCTSLLLIAAFTFVKDVSPLTSAATVEGVFGALYFGVGRGLGGLAGAIAWELIGARNAFRLFSAISLGGALIFVLLNVLHSKKSSKTFSLPTNSKETAVTSQQVIQCTSYRSVYI